MTEAEFRQFAAEGFNRIPLVLETFADLDTPLSVYLKLANRPWSYLLESVQGGERFGRYSFIGLPAETRFEVRGRVCSEYWDNRLVQQAEHDDPLEFVRACQARFRAALPSGLPRFCGGLVGYFGYDIVRYIEPRLAKTVQARRRARRPGYPAAAVRAARRGRQPVGQALSHRVCRSSRAGMPTSGRRPACRSWLRHCGSRSRCRRSGLPRPASRSTSSPRPHSWRRWSVPSATSTTATSCRWCCRSASAIATPPRRCRCTGPCARSIPRRTCSTTTWAGSRSSAPRRRSWCGWRATP